MFTVVMTQPSIHTDVVVEFERESDAREKFWNFVAVQFDDGEDIDCSERYGCCVDMRIGEDPVLGRWQVTLHSNETRKESE